VFENNDMNSTYNLFLNTYLKVFYSSFPLKKLITKTNGNAWITTGIRTSCRHKRELYLLCKKSANPLNVTREAKKNYFSKQIQKQNESHLGHY
jgi:hypothetical protein